jgi:hypothetical protein
MASFDYAAPAELFMTKAKSGRRQPITYRRFATAAEAIKFAIEEVPASLLVGVVLEVAEERFDHATIRELYGNRDHLPEALPE